MCRQLGWLLGPVRFFAGVHLTVAGPDANYVNVMNIHME